MWPFSRKLRAEHDSERVAPKVDSKRAVRFRGAVGRGFAGAKVTDITSSMARTPRPFDGDLRRALNVLRARSREEYQSNDYAKRAVSVIKQNVVGHHGIRLQADPRRQNGNKDKPAAETLEKGWIGWGRRGSPEVTRRLSWIDIQNLCVHSIVVDGEAILVEHDTWNGNQWGYALEFVDPFLLDTELNEDLKDGRKIRMGVELDRFNGPIAYHFLEHDPTQDDYRMQFQRKHRRIPAERVLHIYLPEAVWQTRGVPILATALLSFNMFRGYAEAELVAARTAASKMGFFIDAPDGQGYKGEKLEDGESYVEAAEPGQFPRLPHGVAFEQWDPQHPTSAYKDYAKAVLRGAASGLNVPYNTMANDLEGVTFSSLRQGNMDAHDGWRCFQTLIIDTLMDFAYRGWLRQSLLREVLEIRPGSPLNSARLEKYQAVKWNPRTWDHVQPREQEMANQLKLNNGTHSVPELIRQRGREPEDVVQEMAEWQEMLAAANVTLPTAPGGSNETEDSETDGDSEATDTPSNG